MQIIISKKNPIPQKVNGTWKHDAHQMQRVKSLQEIPIPRNQGEWKATT